MRTASPKHALLAGLLAVTLGALAPLAAPMPAAFANSASTEAQAPSATSPGTPVSEAPTAGTPATPAQTGSGSTSGGAAPTPALGKLTLATWFGPGFYGRSTACGQKMSPTLVGVASRTLPCGTLVQIGYRGRQLTVPVLDRGPYGHNGAMWDLTAGAARALKVKETVRIAAQIVGSVANTPMLGEPPVSSAPSGPLAVAPAAAAVAGGATAG